MIWISQKPNALYLQKALQVDFFLTTNKAKSVFLPSALSLREQEQSGNFVGLSSCTFKKTICYLLKDPWDRLDILENDLNDWKINSYTDIYERYIKRGRRSIHNIRLIASSSQVILPDYTAMNCDRKAFRSLKVQKSYDFARRKNGVEDKMLDTRLKVMEKEERTVRQKLYEIRREKYSRKFYKGPERPKFVDVNVCETEEPDDNNKLNLITASGVVRTKNSLRRKSRSEEHTSELQSR